jgi:molecular chaperone IbpA
MNTIDLSPLYRNTIGFDSMASLIDSAFNDREKFSNGYPPYNIEVIADNQYEIALALAGFAREDLDIHVEKNVLTIKGQKAAGKEKRQFLHQGIAERSFERKFNLADNIEVVGADLKNGMLIVKLIREIPEKMKPKRIEILE